MRILLPIILLTGCACSELELMADALIDYTPYSKVYHENPPTKLSSIKYESACVSIYDSHTTSSNKNIYWYTPIALLENKNVPSFHNETTGQRTLSVSFGIWNPEVKTKVVKHLNQILSQPIEHSQVTVFPFEGARLNSHQMQFASFSLTNEWIQYHNERSVKFSLSCPTRDDCEQVRTEMRDYPKNFEHLRLDFSSQILNDDKPTCFKDGLEIFPETLPTQVKELLEQLIESKLEKLLNISMEETNRDFAEKLRVTEENLAVLQMKSEVTDKELEATKASLISTRLKLMKTKSTVDDLTSNFNDNLENFKMTMKSEFTQTKVIVEELSTKLNAILADEQEFSGTKVMVGNCSPGLEMINELKTAQEELREELKTTLNYVQTTTSNLTNTMRTALNRTKSTVADLKTQLNERTNEIVDISQMPTSCEDLEQMGQKVSGFFLVKGSTKLEAVYCNFYPNENDKQKLIGYVDVKSHPVHFYVQRSTAFDTLKTPITFDLTRLNEGHSMELKNGKFTAQRPGIYFFSFTALAEFPASSSAVHLDVGLYLNKVWVGTGLVEETNTVEGQNEQVSIQSTLKLKKDDQVWVQIDSLSEGVQLLDSNNHHTHFIGFMLDEKFSESL